MQGKKLIARWNDNGALYLHMRHPLHGAEMDLELKPRLPTVIDRVWLESPEFQSMSKLLMDDDDELGEKVIYYWYSDEFPVKRDINTSPLKTNDGLQDMTPDMIESMRQILLGGFTPEKASLLTMVPGVRRNISVGWAISTYMPWLKRVMEEESAFQNRSSVIELCELSISKIREMM